MNYKTISLYDRLKPHFLDEFERMNIKHPQMTGRIIDELQDSCFVTNLKYSTVLDIKFTLGVDNPFQMFKDL